MASTPEGKVKAAVRKVLDAYNVWYFMPVSGGYGKQGIHDFIVCSNGRFLSIECKDEGKRPTRLQDQCAQDIQAAKGITLLIEGVQQVDIVTMYLEMMGATQRETTT